MTFAYGVIGLVPDVFWAMTPREFGCAASAYLPQLADRTTRTALDRLMQAHPDAVRPPT